MPRFDGTGPNGLGRMTGMRRGCCSTEINVCPQRMRSFSCFSNWSTFAVKEKIDVLKQNKKMIEEEIDFLEKSSE